MLRRELNALIERRNSDIKTTADIRLKWNNNSNKEPIARFLKSYAVFVSDHTVKEDIFFKDIQAKNIISEEEDKELLRHYEMCKGQVGGKARLDEMLKLIDYLESRDWATK